MSTVIVETGVVAFYLRVSVHIYLMICWKWGRLQCQNPPFRQRVARKGGIAYSEVEVRAIDDRSCLVR